MPPNIHNLVQSPLLESALILSSDLTIKYHRHDYMPVLSLTLRNTSSIHFSSLGNLECPSKELCLPCGSDCTERPQGRKDLEIS